MDSGAYLRLKEAEKEHLRTLRRLKEVVRLLERRQAIDQALERLTTQTQAVLEAHAEALERLKLETAHQEARLEVSFEGLSEAMQTRRQAQNLLQQLQRAPETPAAAPSPEKTLGRFRPPKA